MRKAIITITKTNTSNRHAWYNNYLGQTFRAIEFISAQGEFFWEVTDPSVPGIIPEGAPIVHPDHCRVLSEEVAPVRRTGLLEWLIRGIIAIGMIYLVYHILK